MASAVRSVIDYIWSPIKFFEGRSHLPLDWRLAVAGVGLCVLLQAVS